VQEFCARRKSHLKEDIHLLQKIHHLLQKNTFICNRRYSSVTTSSAAEDSFLSDIAYNYGSDVTSSNIFDGTLGIVCGYSGILGLLEVTKS
jgi:hypothetical protein